MPAVSQSKEDDMIRNIITLNTSSTRAPKVSLDGNAQDEAIIGIEEDGSLTLLHRGDRFDPIASREDLAKSVCVEGTLTAYGLNVDDLIKVAAG